MTRFVKPEHLVQDPRAESEQDQALYEQSQINLHHINKQLKAHGQSMETLVAAAAKHFMGISVEPHAPKPPKEG